MRKSRQKSKTGLYHIVIRGNNKQNIFFDNQDRKYFLHLLYKYKNRYKIRVHAYCLMENHIHLLLEDLADNLSFYIQTIASIYARYFNKKYDRIGHLYQDRFASETINDDQYYLTAFRYILQNPEKAKISTADKYRWSSYHKYKTVNPFIYRKTVLDLFNNNIQSFYTFINQSEIAECLDIGLRPSEKENNTIALILNILKVKNPIIPPDLPIEKIKARVKMLKNAGISIRKISRITGIMKWIVQSA